MAFVTGAARGQGRSHAVRLGSEGADVIGIDVCAQIEKGYPAATEEDLAETARLVAAAGRSMVAVRADVRHLDEVTAAVDAGLERFGRLDTMEPGDVSHMVAFLASDDSRYMTGAQIPIDMGTLGR